MVLMAVCIIGYFGVGKFYKNQEEKESENKEATAITAFELKDYEKITAFNYIANGTSITLTKDSDGNIKVINKQGKDITGKVDLFDLAPEMIEKITSSKDKETMYKNIDSVYEELGNATKRLEQIRVDATKDDSEAKEKQKELSLEIYLNVK